MHQYVFLKSFMEELMFAQKDNLPPPPIKPSNFNSQKKKTFHGKYDNEIQVI